MAEETALTRDISILLDQIKRLHDLERFEEAQQQIVDILAKYHNDHRIFFAVGNFYLKLKVFNMAVRYLSQAVTLLPQQIDYQLGLGVALFHMKNYPAALERFKVVVKEDASMPEVFFYISRCLVHMDRSADAVRLLNSLMDTYIDKPQLHLEYAELVQGDSHYNLLYNVHAQLYNHLSGLEYFLFPEYEDSFFIVPEQAREVAYQQNRVRCNIVITGLQVCYYFGEPFEDAPENLVAITQDKLVEQFFTMKTRHPTRVVFDLDDPDQVKKAISIGRLMHSILWKQQQSLEALMITQLQINPWPAGGLFPSEPLRIAIPTSRETSVMQYCAKHLADSFKRLGCEVLVILEEHETEKLSFMEHLKQMIHFKPHVFFHINHLNNSYLHPSVFNVTWWQDPMDAITNRKPLPWRKRDLVYCIYPHYDEMLYETGAKKVYRQDFCVDTEIFASYIPPEERNKVVFVGGSHTPHLRGEDNEQQAIDMIKERFVKGIDITDEFLDEVAKATDMDKDYVILGPFGYVVRDTCVEWLCELAETCGFTVEIYGRFWESNPIVSPYFKGEVKHGKEVADIYNQSRYALSALSVGIKSQRLVEISACETIPVVYDARPMAEPFQFMDHMVMFKTKAQLKEALTRLPEKAPLDFARPHAYDVFAKKVIERIKMFVKNGGEEH
ncbi:glycosyltransferase family protein [Magnetococcales bacterium HHB-1]